jgi:hypothetical protein
MKVYAGAVVAGLVGAVLGVPQAGLAKPGVPAPAPVGVVRSALLANGERLDVLPGKGASKSTFRVVPKADRPAQPYAFSAIGGSLRVRPTGDPAQAATQLAIGAPRKAAAAAAETTYRVNVVIDSTNSDVNTATINVWDRDTWAYVPTTEDQVTGGVHGDLAPGNYYATAIYGGYATNVYLLTTTFTITGAAKTVRFNEAAAKETKLTVDDATARRSSGAAWISLPNGDLAGFANGGAVKTYVTPGTVPGTTLRLHEILTKAGASASVPSPYRYDLTRSWPDTIPANPVAAVTTASLAKSVTTVKAQGVNTDAVLQSVPMFGEWTGVFVLTPLRVPATVTEYVTPGISVWRLVDYGPAWSQSLTMPERTLQAGPNPGQTVGTAPLAPAAGITNSRRDNNTLQISEYSSLTDTGGNTGSDSAATVATSLSANREVLKSTATGGLSVAVPTVEQEYQVDQAISRKSNWSQLSTQIRSQWTFRSGASSSRTLPLMDLALSASGLDARNRAGTSPVEIGVTASTRAAASAASRVTGLEYSTDDGATWTAAPVSGDSARAAVSLTVPATTAFVSLRMSAANDAGGSLRRTITRAFAGPATSGDETAGTTQISNVVVNGGKALVVGTSGTPEFYATFTATDPSGIAAAGLDLYHGSYNTPDGVLLGETSCGAAGATTFACSTFFRVDARYSLDKNALAGAWRAADWARASDGVGSTDRHALGSVAIKRATSIVGDATPEPVVKGKTITITGGLNRADWESHTFQGYAAQPVALQWQKLGTTTWTTVKTVQTDTNGKLKTTVVAGSDGAYRFSFAGDATSALVTSVADYVDVQ